MDIRTKKIRELESKLFQARRFIFDCGMCAINASYEGSNMNNKYWAQKAFKEYEQTKPNF